MRIGVLGRLEVRVDGDPVRLGGPAEQHLLAVLLVFANQTVSTGRLVDELWGDDPPATARNLIQTYVSRLRKALGDSDGERLVTEAAGYRLAVRDDELDASRFESLVAEGGSAPDPDSAAARFDEALEMWRGPFLDGLEGGPAVAAERVRLEEARLAALEERIDRDLDRGRHHALAVELTGLSERFPFRERLRSQLMLALYRSGRQAEALRSFADYRDRLGTEMGLQPGQAISSLEERILLDDPALALPTPAGELPEGDVTFLFTDIEGSTALWERRPAEMPSALARHDLLLNQAVTDNAGTVFKSTGDGICAAFGSARDAVGAALEAQRSLNSEPWGATGPPQVRMALHTGAAQLRGGDYLGPPLNRISRLVEAAHGGQIILSQTTAQLVQDHLPDDTDLEDLGEHQLRDLARPEHVYQLHHPDLTADFPPLRSLESFRHNLPHRLTSFIGRHKEIQQVTDALRAQRLVTLVGPGGIGKTSLAIQAAAGLVDTYPGGTWLIELAPVTDGSLVTGAIAATLGVKEIPGQDLTLTLARHLSATAKLLVLDNCEHVIDDAAKITAALLQSAATVRVLATSREPLTIAGEIRIPVPSLQLPLAADMPVTQLASTEAVALFTDRGRLLASDFALDENNSAAIAEICCRLDGIPLAIELAAARLTTVAPSQIAAHLDDRFALLTKGARAAPSRHQTLSALIDWSHHLLTEPERTLFRRLGVFTGGFTLEAAQHVCGGEPLDPVDVPDLLDRLVAASLVTPPDDERQRFGMLETIRQYASRKLGTAGETEASLRGLASFLLEAGPESNDGLPGADAVGWYRWRNDERDNFRTVLDWSLDAEEKNIAAHAAIEFRNYLTAELLGTEAGMWTDRALALLGDETTHRRLRLLQMQLADRVMYAADRSDIPPMAELLYREAQSLGDEQTMGFARWAEADHAIRSGHMNEAVDKIGQAIEHFKASSDSRVVDALTIEVLLYSGLGRYDDAKADAARIVTEAEALGERCDLRWATAASNVFAAISAVYAGELDEAERLLAAEHDYLHELGGDLRFGYLVTKWFLADARRDAAGAREAATELSDTASDTAPSFVLRDAARMRASSALASDGPQAALPELRIAIEHARRASSVIEDADLVRLVADTALAADHHDAATQLHAASSAVHQRAGTAPAVWEQERQQRSLEELRDALGAEHFEALWRRGADLPPDEMLDHAERYVDQAMSGAAEAVETDATTPPAARS